MRQEDGLIPLLTSTGQRCGGWWPVAVWRYLFPPNFPLSGPGSAEALLRRGHSHEYSDSREIKAHISLGSTDCPARHTFGQ